MSRSYKKNPIYKSGTKHWKKFAKKQANKKVRQYKGYIPSGSFYKKLYNSWDIYDYTSRCSYKEYKKQLRSDFKRDLLYYGDINKIPKWNKKRYKDPYHVVWKRDYLWK